MIRLSAITTLFLLLQISFYAQENTIDSLKTLLQTHTVGDKSRVELLIEAANELYRIDIDKSLKYINEADSLAETFKHCKEKAESFRVIGIFYGMRADYDKSLEYFLKALQLFEKAGNQTGMARSYNNLGIVYYYQGDYSKALEYYLKSLELMKETDDLRGIASSYNNIGNVYSAKGDYPKALEYYQNSLRLEEKADNKIGISRRYLNIGTIYSSQGDYSKALEHYQKALLLFEEIGDKSGVSSCYNNIGNIYYYREYYPEALQNYLKSLHIDKEIGDKIGMASSYDNIGEIYSIKGEYTKALESYTKGLQISKNVGSRSLESSIQIGLADMHLKRGELEEAYNYSKIAFALANESGKTELIKRSSETLSKSSAGLGLFEDAYNYHIVYKAMSDSLQSEENIKKILSLEYEYKYEKEKELALVEQEKREAIHTAEIKRQKSIRNSFIFGFILVVLLLTAVLYSFIQKRKTNRLLSEQKNEIEDKNEELTQLNEEITTQKSVIEKSHQQITSSINYAKLIQNAVLPNNEVISGLLPEHFILFRPREIVSGDFYFIKQIKHVTLVAAADCTGHGVPGAFMSMLGIALLNEIVQSSNIQTSDQVLNELRDKVKHSLQQKGHKDEQPEGMDMSFCAINSRTMEMSFAGANNPCWIFRSNNSNTKARQFIVLDADRNPVGVHINEKPFTEHTFQIQKGDTIYIFSDGYHSQFGGEKNEMFKTKRLKDLLSQIQDKDLETQKHILEQTLTEWQGKNDQIDDILIIGVRFN